MKLKFFFHLEKIKETKRIPVQISKNFKSTKKNLQIKNICDVAEFYKEFGIPFFDNSHLKCGKIKMAKIKK